MLNKVGYDPSLMSNAIWGTLEGCAAGTAVAILSAVVMGTYGAVKDGGIKLLVKEVTKKCENFNWS